MMKNGTWGGDLEINAISNCYKCNVVVYQDQRPDLELQNFPGVDRVMRIVYVGSCHYMSVRGKNYTALSERSSSGTVVLRPDGCKANKVVTHEAKPAVNRELQLFSAYEPNMAVIRELTPRVIPEVKSKVVHESKPGVTSEPRTVVPVSKALRVLTKEEIIKRNLKVIHRVKKRFKTKKHICSDQWCGDLPFDQLVTEEMVDRLKVISRKHQLKMTLKFLTMKCPCHSGSYFKYCCFPKMKAW